MKKIIFAILVLLPMINCQAQKTKVEFDEISNLTAIKNRKLSMSFTIEGKWKTIEIISAQKINPHCIGLKNDLGSKLEISIYNYLDYKSTSKLTSAEKAMEESIISSKELWTQESYAIKEFDIKNDNTKIFSIDKVNLKKTILFDTKNGMNYYITLADNSLSDLDKRTTLLKIYNSITLK